MLDADYRIVKRVKGAIRSGLFRLVAMVHQDPETRVWEGHRGCFVLEDMGASRREETERRWRVSNKK